MGECSGLVQKLTKQVLETIQKENIVQTAQAFSKWKRASASKDAEAAAAYLISKLKEYGIPNKRLEFTGYMSSAVSAKLKMLSPEIREFEVVPCGFTRNVEDIQGELCYDYMGESKTHTPEQNVRRFAEFKDKIVLTKEYCSDIAYEAAAAGALGIIGMYNSPEEVPHYFGASNHNGTPTPDNRHLIPTLPCIDCTKSAGDYMIDQMKKGPVRVSISAQAETGVKRASIPVAFIQGAEDNFVLMDGHYDSHCEGMTDNGAGDAIILELARALHQDRSMLKRSILVCWWAGHEFGQYAGSTWFSDTYYEKLRDHCVAHINIDVAGSRGAERIRARTTQMEGKGFTAERIETYTGYAAEPYIPLPHLGEQSFLGREVPITIMLKYEAAPEMQKIWPVGGGYWWHSREDGLDKVDFDHAMRDAKINAEMICEIANSDRIPVDMSAYLAETRRFLTEIERELHPDFDLAPVYPHLRALDEKIAALEAAMEGRTDTDAIIQKTAGALIQMEYTYTSPYEYDKLAVPANFQKLRAAMGVTPDNADETTYLFLKTDFLRSRNRLIGEMDRLCSVIELQLLQWKYKKE